MTQSQDHPAGNLVRNDPDTLFAMGWKGCSHLDCLETCNGVEAHCGRLAIFLREHVGVVGETKP